MNVGKAAMFELTNPKAKHNRYNQASILNKMQARSQTIRCFEPLHGCFNSNDASFVTDMKKVPFCQISHVLFFFSSW